MENFITMVEEISKIFVGIMQKIAENLTDEKLVLFNSELAELDDYVKGLYLKMLCTVIQYENNPVEAQHLFLKWVMLGIGVEDSMEDCMRKALELSETDIQEFQSFVGSSNAKYYFMVDGLLLLEMGNSGEKGYEYMAEITRLLNIPKEDLKYVCMVVKSVLLQESSYYDQSKALRNSRVAGLDFLPYICSYYVGDIVDTFEEKHYFTLKKKLSKGKTYPHQFTEQKVVFENLALNIEEDWRFRNCKEIIFRNCELVSTGGKLLIQVVKNLVFENCKVSGFKDRFSIVECVDNMTVEKCEFVECGYTSERGRESGGVFKFNEFCRDLEEVADLRHLVVVENTLKNCFIDGSCVSGVFIGVDGEGLSGDASIQNNTFIACTSKHGSTIIENFGLYGYLTAGGNKCKGEQAMRIFGNYEMESQEDRCNREKGG